MPLTRDSDAADLEAAVAAAREAFPAWAARMVEERSRLLLRIAEGIEGHDVARIIIDSPTTKSFTDYWRQGTGAN